MAINKNDYLDVDGNYDLKKALVDEIIDEFNTLLAGGQTYNISLQNGWTGTLSYKINDLNQVTLTLNATSAPNTSTLQQIAALPVEIRPNVELMWGVNDYAVATLMVLSIRTSGAVRISQGSYQSIRESVNYQGQITYQI